MRSNIKKIGMFMEILPGLRNADVKGKYSHAHLCIGVLCPSIYRNRINTIPQIIQTGRGIFILKHLRTGRNAAIRIIDEPPNAPCTSERKGKKKLLNTPKKLCVPKLHS
jgi:hypothetical protein